MKVVALDFGSARTGVAVSDPTGTIARPLGVVERAATDDGLQRVAEIVREQEDRPGGGAEFGAFILGQPFRPLPQLSNLIVV